MKKLFTLLTLIVTMATFAQAPQGFNYQAIVRNSAGALITNQIVGFKFSIKQTSASGTTVYSETQYVTPDNLGQVSLVVGTGLPSTTATFSAINWASGTYYLAIELNTGAGFVQMGTTQLLSVPYALYANSSGNSNFNFPNGTNVGDTLNWKWNGSAWVPTSSVSTTQLPLISTKVNGYNLSSSFTSGGTITSDGGYSITSKGVCWSTSPNPTINDNSTNDGTGASNFTSILSNLLPITTYYYRAYATNSIGTGYGITYTFTTVSNPQITTKIISEISRTFAISGGTISSDGGATITIKGVCWSTSPNPTINDNSTNDGTGEQKFFISFISGLLGTTTYYVKAYATNSFGTAYGQEEVFTTNTSLEIGDSYQGGKIAYILVSTDPGYDANTQHGLIAATSDQSSAISWGDGVSKVTGATGTAIGTGLSNTNTIITSQEATATTYAAGLARAHNGGGYTDWYLPSKDELKKLYFARNAIGGFYDWHYWSSSEESGNFAWGFKFPAGNIIDGNYSGIARYKSFKDRVRAVRDF